MIPTAAIVAGVLTFTEPEFFGPTPELLAARESQLLEQDFEGVAVNAPAMVNTKTRNSLPLMIAARFSGDRDWDVPLKDNCVLVAANLQDGTVHFAPAMTSRKDVTRAGRITEPKGEKPDGLAAAAAQIVAVDAFAKIPMAWNSGVWAIGVMHYDWPSNMARIELRGDEPIPVGAVRPIHPSIVPTADESTLPSYIAMGKNPRQPDTGCAFIVEADAISQRAAVRLYGSFALPARAHMIPRDTVTHVLPTGRRANVAAVIPVTCAILGVNWDMPIQFDWAIPAYGEPLREGMTARGYFALDALTENASTRLGPGKYVCYLVIDGRLIGPQRFAVPE